MFFTLNEIKNITEERINSLKENLVAEDKHLEYKLTLPNEKYDDKKEFLSDVSSFANADGGVIFFGIKAKNGIPEEIPGLEIDNPEKEILRLENLLRTSIEPRISGVVFHPLKLSNSRFLM
jgi:predicted HTH transcriptional regulator